MHRQLIVDPDKFNSLCDDIRQAGIVAFDSEFISEHTYRPELCLLQLAFNGNAFVVDPFQVTDLTQWWDIMGDPEVQVVVHGGQAEIRFCLEQGNQTPQNLVDIQIAEGLLSRSYPLGYDALIKRQLGIKASSKQTRTDWRRRPLSDQQIIYAMADVLHIIPVWEKQQKALQSRQRHDWAKTEFDRLVQDQKADLERPSWSKLPKLNRLNKREFLFAQLLADWRKQKAQELNRPLKRILRDDLIIELAKQQPTNEKEILATRDMNRDGYRRHFDEILQTIKTGQEVKKSDLPKLPSLSQNDQDVDTQVLGQLMAIALSNRCAQQEVARQIVGTAADLKQLALWHLQNRPDELRPRIASGWRAELCGDLLTNLLEGKISLRVADPCSEYPLVFEEFNGQAEK